MKTRYRWALLLAALLAWYERDKDRERVLASRYDLTKYRP